MANWHKHLTGSEKSRLADLHAKRREIVQEIAKMMNRAIRRMRRKDGKR